MLSYTDSRAHMFDYVMRLKALVEVPHDLLIAKKLGKAFPDY